MSNISINDKAYAKLMLHCLKHTANDCFGILIGNKDSPTEVTDVVPMSHDKIFAPQLELCLKFIENYMPENKVIGLYENLVLNKEKENPTISNTANYIGECFYKNNFEVNILFEISSIEKTEENSNRIKDKILFKVNFFNFRFINMETIALNL
jgi:hypothetical protein